MNLSFSWGSAPTVMTEALNNAWLNHQVLIFGATGNDGASSVDFPASHQYVHGVGAIGQHPDGYLYLWEDTNTGVGMDLVAPGVNVPVSGLSGVLRVNGTSAASAFASGVAALLKSVSVGSNVTTGFMMPLDYPVQISGAWTIDAWKTVWFSNCFRADSHADGTINTLDVQSLAYRWGSPSLYRLRYELSPLGGDGNINTEDIQTFYARRWWGQTCPNWSEYPP